MKKSILLLFWVSASAQLCAGQLQCDPPPKPGPGFFQVLTTCCSVESNVSAVHAKKVAEMVKTAELKFYNLFKLTPDLMNGCSAQKFDNKANIPGDYLRQMGMRSWIEVRVHKDEESFMDEWFEKRGVTDKAERLRTGTPGAYFSLSKEYKDDKWIRRIRTYVSNRDDDELERTLLHEMGHLFMQTYLLEFAGDGGPNEKRGTPAWLGEGVAQLFELLWSKAESSAKAKMRQQAMIYEAINAGDSYPFNDFINITNAHNLAAVAGNPLGSTLNYAQSMSVMDYMVNVDGARFFNFLQTLRELHFQRNLRTREENHVPELYSFQEEAFKKAFNADLLKVEEYWKKHVKTTMELALKKQPELNYWIGEYYLLRRKDKVNDIVKAEEKFQLAVKLAPAKGQGYLGMGRMLMRKKDHAGALEAFKKAAELMPKDEDALYYLGLAQINTGNPTEAIACFEKALKIFPRNHRAQQGLGSAAYAEREYEKSMLAYEQAYQISHDPIYLFQKGTSAFFAKKYREAQNGFAAYVSVYPKDADGHFWYGMSAWRLGDKNFAMKKMEEALSLQPNDPQIQAALAMAKTGQGMVFVRESDDEEVAKAKAAGKKVEKAKPEPVILEDE